MYLEQWSVVLTQSFQDLWHGVIQFIPSLFIAIIVFIIGWLLGLIVGHAVEHIISKLKIDDALRSAGLEEVAHRGGFTLNAGAFVGGLIKWFIIVAFLVASFDILGLTQVNEFLNDIVLAYLPRVIIAVLILLAGAVLSGFLQRIVVGAAKAAHVGAAQFLGNVTYWAIWLFTVITALDQLVVAGALVDIVQILFTGVVIAVSIAVGLSFGLGGQYAAAGYIERMKKDFSPHTKD